MVGHLTKESALTWQVQLLNDKEAENGSNTLIEARRGFNSYVGLPVAGKTAVIKRFETVSYRSLSFQAVEEKAVPVVKYCSA